MERLDDDDDGDDLELVATVARKFGFKETQQFMELTCCILLTQLELRNARESIEEFQKAGQILRNNKKNK